MNKKNIQTWKDFLPHVEFTKYSPFQIVYGFNPWTHVDLFPLPLNEQANLSGKAKPSLWFLFMNRSRRTLKKRQEYEKFANRKRRELILEPKRLGQHSLEERKISN